MPDPKTIDRFKGLILSATEIKGLTGWPNAMVEDYLTILDSLITLANLLDIEIDQKIESIPTDFIDGSIPFADSGFLIEDGDLSWNNTDKILSVSGLQLDLLTTPSAAEGLLRWNDDEGTAEIGMPGGNVNLQIGFESLIRVVNKTGSTIPNGKLVYYTGSQGNKLTIGLADKTDANKIFILGMTTESIVNNANGYVALYGDVRGDATEPIDTSSFSEGDKLYLDTAGGFTNVHPVSATDGVVVIGIVRSSHATEGIIYITPPESFTIGNEFNGTIRQSVINKSTGNAAGAGFTAINDNNHYTTIGIAGSGNVTFPNEVSIHYAPGYGDHWQAVDGNKDFVWFTDPTDSHNNSSLSNEIMRLFSNGNLRTSSGRINKTTRVTTTYTILVTDHVIFCDTDGGDFTATLPAGVEGQHFKIINCGSNTLTVDPNGTEELYGSGAGVASTLAPGEVINIHYNATEGWF